MTSGFVFDWVFTPAPMSPAKTRPEVLPQYPQARNQALKPILSAQ
jgi:hypothetical protein